jgi:hypothetical protein
MLCPYISGINTSSFRDCLSLVVAVDVWVVEGGSLLAYPASEHLRTPNNKVISVSVLFLSSFLPRNRMRRTSSKHVYHN